LSGNNSKEIVELYENLAKFGKYSVGNDVLEALQRDFVGGFCDDDETKEQIKQTFDEFGYLADTHTAVALKVYTDYKNRTVDQTPALIASTANPYKFSTAILSAFGESAANDFEAADKLSALTCIPIPKNLSDLDSAAVRFNDVMDRNNLTEYIVKKLGLQQ
jgi:threonine synthase